MKMISISTILTVSGTIAAGSLLFWTSLAVQQKEDRLEKLEAGVAAEQQSLRVLSAEWDYLNRPDRLEVLAKDYLDLTAPPVPQSFSIDASFLPDPMDPALPSRKPLPGIRPAAAQQGGKP